ncbi:MAG TPA: NUDIX domain-containing protein [Candidatus Saccharimonadales bacterium]|nr:NUDIX domain-containing protein [Candidatus Saccharimonadales bacterium]
MGTAARAIIIEDNNLLVMHRNKHGSKYFTLVGGQVAAGETPEQALVREVREETGLTVTAARLVYLEEHAAPYNHQYIYLCTVAPHGKVVVQGTSEEGLMNRISINTHEPLWVHASTFAGLPFRTIALQHAIITALKKGFPNQPVKLS